MMDFYLNRWFGESAGFIIGAVYVALVLLVPYGIVGTWRQRGFRIREGWERLARLLTGSSEPEVVEPPG